MEKVEPAKTMFQSTTASSGAIAQAVTPLFSLHSGRLRRAGDTGVESFTLLSQHESVEQMYYRRDSMSDNEARQMASLAACLHEQIERLLLAKEWAQVKRIKRLSRLVTIAEALEQTVIPHRQAVERYLGVGSEKGAGEVDRQSTSPIEHVVEIGVSALGVRPTAVADDGA